MNRDLDEARIASPCVSVCVIDQASGLCAGCYRTLAEIASWIDLSATERRAVVAELPSRRTLHGAAIERRLAAEGQDGQR